MLRISRDKVCYELVPISSLLPHVDPGERVVLETHDSRNRSTATARGRPYQCT